MIEERPGTFTWPCEEPILHAERLLHLHLINQWSKKGTTLTYAQPMNEERHITYIWSTNDQRKDQHLYMINQWSKKGSALISNQPMIEERLCTYIWQSMSERLNTYIRPCKEPILHVERDLHLHPFNQWLERRALTSDLVGTNPTVISEWSPFPDWATW